MWHMARGAEITASDLARDLARVLDRAERGEHLRVVVGERAVASLGPVEEADHWTDSKTMEERLRSAQADPALGRLLDELQPDTIADL